MTTLADEYLTRGFVPKVYGKSAEFHAIAHNIVLDALSRRSVIEAQAERIVFETDPRTVVAQLRQQKVLDDTVLASGVRMPCPLLWLEWRPDGEPFRAGYLVNQDAGGVDIICAMDTDDGPAVYGMAALDPLPLPPTMEWMCRKVLMLGRGPGDPGTAQEVKYVAWDIVAALFLLNIPRITQVRDHVPSPKLQRARVRAGKPQLLTVKKVRVTIGQGRTRIAHPPGQVSPNTGTGGKRPYHHVIGHFRTYREGVAGRTRSWVDWIDEQWRGDPAVGVVLKERVARPPRRPLTASLDALRET